MVRTTICFSNQFLLAAVVRVPSYIALSHFSVSPPLTSGHYSVCALVGSVACGHLQFFPALKDFTGFQNQNVFDFWTPLPFCPIKFQIVFKRK